MVYHKKFRNPRIMAFGFFGLYIFMTENPQKRTFQAANNHNWSFSTAFCGKRKHRTEKSHKTKIL